MNAGRFEECQGMGKSFGYNRNETAENYRSTTELLRLLIDTVSRGGNVLLDIGPTADGRIPAIMEQRLLEMGEWLAVNGEAIYGTIPWDKAPEMEDVRFTRKDSVVYAICLKWPGSELLIPNTAGAKTIKASLLGYGQPLTASADVDTVRVQVPCIPADQMPCRHAYVFKLEM